MIKIGSNIRDFTKGLTRLQKKQMPYATSKAINKIAKEKAEPAITKELRRLDNPIPFTIKGTFVKYSNKNQRPITAIVGVKDIQAKYLIHAEEGGISKAKGKAKPVPTSSAKNKYGNLPKSKTEAIGKGKVFSDKPRGGRPGGIYQRMGTKKNPKLKMIASWHRSTRHTPQIRIGARVRIAVDRNFNKELAKQLASAMR